MKIGVMRLFDSLNPKVLHVFYCHRSSTSMISFFLFVGRVMLIDIINDGFILSYSPLIKSGFKHCDASSCKLLHTENLAFRHCILFYLIINDQIWFNIDFKDTKKGRKNQACTHLLHCKNIDKL